ncbi:histidine kinase [Salinibacterium sp.]|uniref:sensor histidine kinase n=1 Tax=Salinibacterium sp. TaxID=1915057 RepID=UPI00286A1A3C|nr:histidine kinase [Salinibacterium sp.]
MNEIRGRRVREAAQTAALLVGVTAPVAIDLLWVARIPESVVPMTALTAIVALPLIWRALAPAAVFWSIAAMTGVGLIALSVPGLASSIMTMLPMAAAAYQLALVGRPVSTTRFALTLVVLFTIDLVVLYQVAPAGAAWQGSALALFLILFAWSVGLGTRQRLEAARDRAQLESERAQHAAHDERERIARELHDGLAHHLTALVLRTEAARARQSRSSERTSDKTVDLSADLTAIAENGRRAVDEITVILDVLRGVRPAPGFDQLDDLVELARSSGSTVRFSRTGVGSSTRAGATSYRVVQEALTNARRHGAWREVDVVVSQENGGTTIIVSNPVDAAALVPRSAGERPGLGLTGIRERVAEHGGEVWVSRTADRFTLRTWIPAER